MDRISEFESFQTASLDDSFHPRYPSYIGMADVGPLDPHARSHATAASALYQDKFAACGRF